MIIKKNGGGNYIDIVKFINCEITLLQEVASMLPDKLAMAKLFSIRHDVDHNIVHALRFAEVEAEYGIKATYFLLNTAKYFDYSNDLFKKIGRISHLGHEIGFHNNLYVEWLGKGQQEDLQALAAKPIAFINEAIGGQIVGTASHGDPMNHFTKVNNYEVWTECRRAKTSKYVPHISLADVGLGYEAYHLRRDAYLSESGAIWQGGVRSEIDPHEKNKTGEQIRDRVIEWFNGVESGVLQVLVHPCWWEVN